MPKNLYCWRCGEDVPALTETEMEYILPLWQKAVGAARIIGAFDIQIAARTMREFEEVRAEYEQMTGRGLGNRCLQIFHRLSDFGPPCPQCGKSLRTAEAGQCWLCGWRRNG